jgi:hypothetical protein
MTKKHVLALSAAGAVMLGATAASAQSGGLGIIRASSPAVSNSVNEYGAEPQTGLRSDVRAHNAAQVRTRGQFRASRNYVARGPAISNSMNEYGAEPQTGLRHDMRGYNGAHLRTRGNVRAGYYAPGPFAVPGAAIGAAGAVAGAAVGGAANVAGGVVGGPAYWGNGYDDPYAANASMNYGWRGQRDSQFTPGFNAPTGAAQGQHYETPIGYGSIFTSPNQ